MITILCAGTTAAGFRAGVPSIIIPFSNDQFAWAHRSYDLGVGAKPISKKDLDTDNLAAAITYALSEPIVSNVKGLGEKSPQKMARWNVRRSS